MEYPLMPAARQPRALSAAEETEARLRKVVHETGRACLGHRLLIRLYRIPPQGLHALAPLVAYLGWPLVISPEDLPDDEERDAIDELLLLAFVQGYPLMPRGELVIQLFVLLQDTQRFSATRLGRRCTSIEGYRVCTQLLHDRACSAAEINLLLAVWLRDRMCARGCVRDVNAGLRLYRKDRVAMAARLSIR